MRDFRFVMRVGDILFRRPLEPIRVGRTERDTEKVLDLYDEGHREVAAAVRLIV